MATPWKSGSSLTDLRPSANALASNSLLTTKTTHYQSSSIPTGTLRVGATEAPFAVASLAKGENVELRIFIDKYLVEVFANDRQALIATHFDHGGKTALHAYSFGDPTTIATLEIWKLRATNQGFLEAQRNRIWEPETT